jgi:hypothetical protein
MAVPNQAAVVEPSADLREIRRLQPLIYEASTRANKFRPGSIEHAAAGEKMDDLLHQLGRIGDRVYAKPATGWMEIVERAELAVTWCSDNYQASGIRDLAGTAEPDKRAMAHLVDAVLTVAEGDHAR